MPLPTIIIDTREQRPLFLDEQGVVRNGYTTLALFVRTKLDYGDYSLTGLEGLVSIERKSVSDLRNSLMGEHRRFVKELVALGQMKRAWIVVEGSEVDFTGYPGMVDYRKFRQMLVSIQVHYGIPIYWAGTREGSEQFVFAYLTTFLKYYRQGKL